MLARPVTSLPTGANWLYELKLDGYRALVLKTGGVVTVFSRRGNILNVPRRSNTPNGPQGIICVTRGLWRCGMIKMRVR